MKRTLVLGEKRAECYGLNYVPPKLYVEILTSNTSEYDLFRDRIFTEVIKLKARKMGFNLR